MDEQSLCVCCGRPATADVEVSAGLELPVCHQHLERRRAAEVRHHLERGRFVAGTTASS